MEKISAIARVIENNRDRIFEAKKILDSAAALSLLGASIDAQARGMIVTGTLATIGGSSILAGVAITGITGPVILGVAVAPTMAKIGIITGLGIMIGGFVRGFRKGLAHTKESAPTIKSIEKLLLEHGESINNINLHTLLSGTQQHQPIEVK